MLVGINAQKLFMSRDYRNAGISRYIRSIAAQLPRLPGHERYLLYTNDQVRAWPGVEGERVRIAGAWLPTSMPLVRILWEQTVLPVLAMRDGIDVLHCPLNVQPVISTCPVVLTIHDLTFLRFPDRFNAVKQRYLAALTGFSARRAHCILADSAATKADVAAAFGIDQARIDVVYPGFDPDFRPIAPDDAGGQARLDAFRARHDLPQRFVLYLGTLEPRKNVDRLVAAFSALVARGMPHALVLAGGKGWHYEAIFDAIEAHGLQDRVLVPGYVAREEQPLWYNAADLFVYPSQYEGFGLPPLEAMACGVPVVTSATSSLPEVVGNAGMTVDVDDLESLSEAMAAVLTDSGRAAAMRAAGLQRAATFTWEAAAQGCLKAYRSAAGLTLATAT